MTKKADIFDIRKEFENRYGVSFEPVEKFKLTDGYIKLEGDDLARANALLQQLPYLLKQDQDAKHYAGAFKVIYDEGLGVLQKAANNPGFYRANVVNPGTNNGIRATALLQPLEPTQAMQLSNIALSSFQALSVVTNQYFLASIDDRLKSLNGKVEEMQAYLEKEKESQLWAQGEFIRETKELLDVILVNEQYCQARLANLQEIRVSALSNIKLYCEELNDLKDLLNVKDGKSKTEENFNRFNGYLPKLWYSVYLYQAAYALEVYLSQITDAKFCEKISGEMKNTLKMFEICYGDISIEIDNYIKGVKSLNSDPSFTNVVQNLGEALAYARNPYFIAASVILKVGGVALEKYEKTTKANYKQLVIENLEEIKSRFSTVDLFKCQIEIVENLNYIYNNPLEIVVDGEDVYMKKEA